jgi:hypothetical protein
MNQNVLTDCRGVGRIPGTGYFNSKGSLIGIHAGEEVYSDGAEGVTEVTEERVNDVFRGPNVGCQINQMTNLLPQQCYDDLATAITLSSRKRSGSVVPAKYLFEIVDGIREHTLTPFKPP